MSKPSYLLIGGTGTISTEVVRYLLKTEHPTACVTRGSKPLPEGAEAICCDADDTPALEAALQGRHFDVAVDFITFTP
ncbi:MAG: NmrA family NAD(P)-binding protein [Clostridia bacterium]|nr:NmrA family NAD(P)-binding protein [Clostridia bacterium]